MKITYGQLKMKFIDSVRFQHLLKSFDVMAIVKAGPIDLSTWTHAEIAESLDWINGKVPYDPIPKRIAEYLKKVKENGTNNS